VPPRIKGAAAVAKTNTTLDKLAIEYRAVGDIRPNNYNPNRQSDHEFRLLCRSIEEDGFTQPVIVSRDYTIVDGEHRWRAALHLGLPEIPVVVVPMDTAQAKIATLRHNRARGSEDLELSVEVLRDLEKLGALDWAADSLDLSDAELNRLLDDVPAPEALAGEEFSTAWVPGRDGAASDLTGGGTLTAVAATPAALTMAREKEIALRGAKTEQERQTIAQERQVYRISLSFTDDEALIVKEALGDQPATAVLDMCRGWHAAKTAREAAAG
jgi:ParB/RepB/Spo0J family partition protein